MPSSHPHPDWQPLDPAELSRLLPDTYEVQDLLGRGGMGAVYLARQVNLDRHVAIKVLPLQDAAQADDAMHFAERFVQEARTMARISHSGIVAVYDFGRVKVKPANSELLYLVMEYMDGTDVLNLIRGQGRLPPDDALSITAHVCDALAFAHEKGLIHRDIKPANVMINADGFVKVADFGLARPVSINSSAGLTQSGYAVGTPDFMAPETLTADAVVDHRSDLYSVGVMLYQMLTGQIPRGAFKPASAVCGCDPRLDRIIDKAMQSNPADRYATAAELRGDLDKILTTPRARAGDQTSAALRKAPAAKRKVPAKPAGGPPARASPPSPAKAPAPPPRPPARPPVALGIALLVAAGVVFAVWKAAQKPAPRVADTPARPPPVNAAAPAPSSPAPVEPVKPVPVVQAKLPDTPGAASPGPGESPHAILTSPDHEWTPPESPGLLVNSNLDDSAPFLSPNGLELYFDSPSGKGLVGEYDLYVSRRDTPGSTWRERENLGATINSTRSDRSACLSADGLTLFFNSDRDQPGKGLYRLWQCSRKSLSDPWTSPGLVPMPAGTGVVADLQPALSADGLQLVFHSSHRGGMGSNDLWEMRRGSPSASWGEPVHLGEVLNSVASENDPVLSSDGRVLIFVRSSELWMATRADARAATPWSAPRKLDRVLETGTERGAPCLSHDGGTLYFCTRGANKDWDIVQSRRVRKGGATGISAVAVTPPATLTTPVSSYEILTSPDYEWGPPENLVKVNSGDHDESPCLSGDGLTLWFNSWLGSGKPNNELWFAQRASLDSPWSSRTKAEAPLNHESIDCNPAISADGLTLIFSSQRDTGFYRLWQSTRASPTAPWSMPTQIRSLYANGPGNVSDDHTALAANGLLLIFRSDERRGGKGGTDLWGCRRASISAEWGAPFLLERGISSPGNERSPVLAAEDRVLLFIRQGEWWRTTRSNPTDDTGWTPPVREGLSEATLRDGCISADGTEFIGHAYAGVSSGFNHLDLVRCRRIKKGPAAPPVAAPVPAVPSALYDQIKPEPWLAEAKKRGGRLKAIGSEPDGSPLTLGPAANLTDVREVFVDGSAWLAWRANGDAVVSTLDKDRKRVFREESQVAQVARGSKLAYRRADGEVRMIITGVPTRYDELKSPDGAALVATHDAAFVLDGTGNVVKHKCFSGVLPLPAATLFAGHRAISGAEQHVVLIDASGRPQSWRVDLDANNRKFDAFPPEFRNLVECEGIHNRLVLFRDTAGRVFTSGASGTAASSWRKPVPADLPPAVRVRGGDHLQLAQLPNGTWRAWGAGEGTIPEQVQRVGPALDMDGNFYRFTDSAGKPQVAAERLVLYVEPVTAPAVVPPSGVSLSDQVKPEPGLAEAKQRGGRLRVFGTDRDGKPMTLGPAEKYDDFVEVHAFHDEYWLALRANGDAVLSRYSKGRAERIFEEESRVAQVSRGWKVGYRLADGRVKTTGTTFQEWDSLKDPNGKAFLAIHDLLWVLDDAGKVLAQYRNGSATVKNILPEDFFVGNLGRTSAELTAVVIGADGRPRGWNAWDEPGKLHTAFPPEFKDLVECEGGSDGLVMFRDVRGKVFATDARGLSTSWARAAPADLPPVVRARCGHGLQMAQLPNGTWRAWGEGVERGFKLADQINALGPALDLDGSYVQNADRSKGPNGYVLYIEPAGPPPKITVHPPPANRPDPRVAPGVLSAGPASVPWPVEQPWLRAARQQGGRLKAVGTYYDGTPVELGPAATLDDFVEVHAYGSSWIALRADGSGVLARKPDNRPWQFDKETAIAQVSPGWKAAYRRGNGDVKILHEGEWRTQERLLVPDAGGFVTTHVGHFVLDRAGQATASWQDATAKPVPADFLAGARDYSGSEMHLLAIGADGVGRSWVAMKPDNPADARKIFPAPLRDLVECEGVDNGTAAVRTRLGRVYVCDLNGKLRTPASDSFPPADLPPAVRVRGGTRIYAAQAADGTWRAWGDNLALAELIQGIGPALDLDGKSARGDLPGEKSRGYALYIEPRAGALGRKPVPRPPPREALSYGRSRYLYVPLPGSAPPHWDAARQRAEEMGGQLAVFETPAEQAWVVQNVAMRRLKEGQLAWVGGWCESKAEGWRWVDGRPLTQAAWRPGQPDTGSAAGAGDFPAFLSLRCLQGAVGLHDESDGAEGSHAWISGIAGFIVEWD